MNAICYCLGCGTEDSMWTKTYLCKVNGLAKMCSTCHQRGMFTLDRPNPGTVPHLMGFLDGCQGKMEEFLP